MGEEETKTVDQREEPAAAATTADFSDEKKPTKNESSDKTLVSIPLKEMESFSKPPSVTQKDAADSEAGKTLEKPKDRDVALAQVETERKLALIKAWEENEKAKADNKAYKKLSDIDAWENTKRASVEAQLKQIEEKFERKKAEYAEKMKNKVAMVHKAAEEKRAMIEAHRGKDFLMVEEAAAKFRTTGSVPKRLFACLSC